MKCLIEEVESPADPLERCIRLFARIAATNAKFHSSLIQADPYIVGNVGQRKGNQEDISTNSQSNIPTHFITFIFSVKKFRDNHRNLLVLNFYPRNSLISKSLS